MTQAPLIPKDHDPTVEALKMYNMQALFQHILHGINWIPDDEASDNLTFNLEVVQPKFDSKTFVHCDGEAIFILDPDAGCVYITSRLGTRCQYQVLCVLCELFGWSTWAEIDYVKEDESSPKVILRNKRNPAAPYYRLEKTLSIELPTTIKKEIRKLRTPPITFNSSGKLRKRYRRRFRSKKHKKLLDIVYRNFLYG